MSCANVLVFRCKMRCNKNFPKGSKRKDLGRKTKGNYPELMIVAKSVNQNSSQKKESCRVLGAL
jgi:hypothetical protein